MDSVNDDREGRWVSPDRGSDGTWAAAEVVGRRQGEDHRRDVAAGRGGDRGGAAVAGQRAARNDRKEKDTHADFKGSDVQEVVGTMRGGGNAAPQPAPKPVASGDPLAELRRQMNE